MKIQKEKLRTWAEIDLDALERNHTAVKKYVGEKTKLCAVIKADAYGHGAVRVAKLLEKQTDYFAVAMAEEALELRNAGITAKVIVLGPVPEGWLIPLIGEEVTLTVTSLEEGRAVCRAAKELGKRATVHLALDTGMGRIGFLPDEQSLEEISLLWGKKELYIEGIFSHFAGADEEDLTFARTQQKRFDAFLEKLAQRNIRFALSHLFNSAAICNMHGSYGMVREGLLLYGLPSSPFVHIECLESLTPVMTVKSKIIQVKTVPPGTPVSYGSTYVTKKETKIATVCAGYADGVPRLLSNRGEFLVSGQRARILGRVCMDQLMLDVTNIDNVGIGTEVVLFGTDKGKYLDCGKQMELCGGISYELLCAVGKRVPRIYMKNGKPESIASVLPFENTV